MDYTKPGRKITPGIVGGVRGGGRWAVIARLGRRWCDTGDAAIFR